MEGTETAGILGMTLTAILEIYAATNIVLVVLLAIAVRSGKRNGGMIKRINRMLDKIYGFDEPSAPKPAADDNAGNKDETPDSPPDGITRLTLGIGDEYKCRLSAVDRNKRTYRMNPLKWVTDNEFVGIIKDRDTFAGLRAGTVKVLCSKEDDDFDTGAVMYEITVTPARTGWPGQTAVSDVIAGSLKAKVAEDIMERKILSENPSEGLMSLSGGTGDEGLTVQFTKDGKLVRALVRMRDNKPTRDMIAGGLDELMEEIEVSGDTRMWIHRIIDESVDEVDSYAILSPGGRGTLVLLSGRAWRDNEDIEEFLLNISVSARLFRPLLGQDEDIPAVRFTGDIGKYRPDEPIGEFPEDRTVETGEPVPEPEDRTAIRPEGEDGPDKPDDSKPEETGEPEIPDTPDEADNKREEKEEGEEKETIDSFDDFKEDDEYFEGIEEG